MSMEQQMPNFLPDRVEAGTLNVPGIAGLQAGLSYLYRVGVDTIGKREQLQARRCSAGLAKMGYRVFYGPHQGGAVSFVPQADCQQMADFLAKRGIAVRSGLHCAPLAHESAGTIETGTVRVSFGHDANAAQTASFLQVAADFL